MRWSDQLSMYLGFACDSDQASTQLPVQWLFLVIAFKPRPMKMSKRKMMNKRKMMSKREMRSKREMITQNWAKSKTL